jgi:hypothetical protein
VGGPRLIGGEVAAGAVAQQSNLTASASSFAGADSIAAPNFWPNAAVQAQAALARTLDPLYASDSPQPFVLRAMNGSARTIGALQSAR